MGLFKGVDGLQGLFNPTPEQKKENAKYLKHQLGVSDEEKYAVYTVLLFLLNLIEDELRVECFHNVLLKDSVELIRTVYAELEVECKDSYLGSAVSLEREEDDDE